MTITDLAQGAYEGMVAIVLIKCVYPGSSTDFTLTSRPDFSGLDAFEAELVSDELGALVVVWRINTTTNEPVLTWVGTDNFDNYACGWVIVDDSDLVDSGYLVTVGRPTDPGWAGYCPVNNASGVTPSDSWAVRCALGVVRYPNTGSFDLEVYAPIDYPTPANMDIEFYAPAVGSDLEDPEIPVGPSSSVGIVVTSGPGVDGYDPPGVGEALITGPGFDDFSIGEFTVTVGFLAGVDEDTQGWVLGSRWSGARSWN